MKKTHLIFLSMALFILASCSDLDITGHGPIVSETREVNPFHSIKSQVSADIYLTQEADQLVRIETNENIIPIIDTRVVNGQLIIDTNRSFRTSGRVKVYISASDFQKITMTGSGSLESMNCMNLNALELRITGSADMNLCGVVENFTAEITGSGSIDAYGLETQSSEVRISGSGDIRLTAYEFLSVRISGSGDVRYKGNPEVNSTISGSGRVINAN